MTFRTVTKRATFLSLFLGILLASSVAFAWWTASGSGSGYASAGSVTTIDTLSVNAIAATANDLYPGGTTALKIEIRNQNPFPVKVTAINANGSVVTAPTDAVCDAANSVSLSNIDLTGLPGGGLTVAANSTSGVQSFANKVSMNGPAAVDACQGETFVVPVTLVATSA
jgi:hypothetical protein